MTIQEFKIFQLSEKIEKGLLSAGFQVPSPIQKKAIPLIMQGYDIVAQAHTGTGKTAAFGLPLMSLMENNMGVEMLVVTPTRELALQVSDELYKLGKYAQVKTATVYGGQSYARQIKQIDTASILVATPGRLLDLLKSKRIKLKPNYIVLDEADEMLNMGFIDDVKKILAFMPVNAQKLLFSATMPEPIKNIANEFLNAPQYVKVTSSQSTNKDIFQEFYLIEERERENAVIRLIDFYHPNKAIIFCRMKKETENLATILSSKGYAARALNGDMEQSVRETTMKNFKSGTTKILVATDIAARGLDIADTSHVFNYHLPFDTQSYVHRIGRTGRAGKKGVAITLITPFEFRSLQKIKKSIGAAIEYKVVPSMQKVHSNYNEKLLHQIIDQVVDPQAIELSAALEKEMDFSQMVHKLLSLLLEKQKVSGPETIGLNEHNAKKVIEKYKVEKHSARSKRSNKNFRKSSRRKQNSKPIGRDSKRRRKNPQEKNNSPASHQKEIHKKQNNFSNRHKKKHRTKK